MQIKKLINTRNKIIKYCSDHGVPVVLLYDPKTGRGSVSLTLVFISFNIWILSIMGVTSDILGGVDQDQAFNMVLACFGLYYGRKLTLGNKELDNEGIQKTGMDVDQLDGQDTKKQSKETSCQNCTCKIKKTSRKRNK